MRRVCTEYPVQYEQTVRGAAPPRAPLAHPPGPPLPSASHPCPLLLYSCSSRTARTSCVGSGGGGGGGGSGGCVGAIA
jgi:hypothetical protein